MTGPNDSSFRRGLFYLRILFPDDYPTHKPEVCFLTPIYHVNIKHRKARTPTDEKLGHVCISTLNFWKPTIQMREVLTNIFALFYLGNPQSPYGLDRQAEMMNNKPLYEEKCAYFTKKYAHPSMGVKEYFEDWDFTYP